MNETDSGTLGSTNPVTHLSLVPSCGGILKMSSNCVLFVHNWCAASEHIADCLDENMMCESGSLQWQGNQ
jgi:hypothetical protein